MEIKLTDEELEQISDRVRDEISERVYEWVKDALDYHEDQFRVSWMRMMEAECDDLESIRQESACDHGQKVYRALFHVVDQRIGQLDQIRQQLDRDLRYMTS